MIFVQLHCYNLQMKIFFTSTLILLLSLPLVSQVTDEDNNKPAVVQFSGVVVTMDEYGEMIPLPYAAIGIKNSARGTYSETDGFFSIVAQIGDTLVFSRLGFETSEHAIPDTLDSQYYSWYQVMAQGDLLLPEAVIYPWPDKDHYKIEFLALDVSNELRQRAEKNLAAEVLQRMQHEVAGDGRNSFQLEQARSFEEFKYSGQYKPQKIFDVVAWSQFIKAWKRGDFKRKKKK